MHSASDPLAAPFLLFVLQSFLQLIRGQFRPYSEGVRGVAASHTVALYHVLRIVFLPDGDGPFLTIASDTHAGDLRKSLHGESTLIGNFRLNF